MHFFLDENVPVSVAQVLRERGHEVSFVVDILAVGSPDPVVATASEELSAVLVSADRDFKSIGARIQMGRIRYSRLSRVALMCNEPQASQRMEKAIGLIESEYEIAQNSHDKRMIVAIGNSFIRTDR